MPDGEISLKDIRKEVVETRNAMIQTQNLVEGIQTNLKVLAKKQDKYGRRYFLNTLFGYLLVLVVSIGSLVYVFNSRLSDANGKIASMADKLKDLEGRLSEFNREQGKREAASAAALRVYSMLRSGNDLTKAAALFRGLDKDSLDPAAMKILSMEARQIFEKQGKDSFLQGRSEVWKAHYQAALPHLDRALDLAPSADFSAEAHWRRGFAFYKTGQLKKAVQDFDAVLKTAPDSEFGDDAAYYKAYCLEMLGEKKKAVQAYKAFLSAYPKGDKANLVKKKVQVLEGGKRTDERTSQPEKAKPKRTSSESAGSSPHNGEQNKDSPGTGQAETKPPPATPQNLKPPAE